MLNGKAYQMNPFLTEQEITEKINNAEWVLLKDPGKVEKPGQ